MTRNKHHDTLKPIAGGNAGGSFGGGGGGMAPGTDGQILVTAGGQPTWTTPNYVATPDLTTTLALYPTKTELTTTLGTYETKADLTTTLGTYVTKAGLATELAPLIAGIEHGAAVIDVAQKPTGTEPEGSLYIVGTAPTDDFAGHANTVAFLDNGQWVFATPQPNEAHLNEKTNQILHWNGTAWNSVGSVSHVGEVATLVFHKCTVGHFHYEIYGSWQGTTKPGYTYVMEFGGTHTAGHNNSICRYRMYVDGSMATENGVAGGSGYLQSSTVKWYVDGTGKVQTLEFRLNYDGTVAFKQLWCSVTEIRHS